MLTIGKLGASAGQLDYYERQVAAGAEDYYAGRGESPGTWMGRGLDALGVASGSQVEREAFLGLMQGRHPADGSQLRRMTRASTVAAIDLTFSAPKSVSILYAVAGGEMSAELSEAHERAVAAAVSYLEREACLTRRGHAGGERVAGEGFVARRVQAPTVARRRPATAHARRRRQPHSRRWPLHLAGRARAVMSTSRRLVRSIARCCAPRSATGCRGCSGARPAAGCSRSTGCPKTCCVTSHSAGPRSRQRAVELVGAEAARSLSREQMQGIALATRRPKARSRVGGAQWREDARARSAEHGFGPDELWTFFNRPDPTALVRRSRRPSAGCRARRA